MRRGLAGQPGSLDPQRAEDAFSYDVLRDLYEGLVTSDPAGRVVPAAAESWEVSADRRTYTFSLRRNARWSNGDTVTAGEFVAALRRALDPATASGAADLLRAIEHAPEILRGELAPDRLGVRAPDEHRLEIRLSRPVPYFPDILTNTVVSPVHASTLAGDGGFSRPGATVTNGPYRLAALAPGSSLHLVRNEHYWDRAAVAYDEVRYEIVPDENAEFARFRAGELDVTNSVPEQRFEELARDPDSGLQHRPWLATFYFTLNTDRGPLRGRPDLRQALSLALDREAIATAIARAGQVPAYALVPDGVWNYAPARYAWSGASRDERLARARSLYAAAGFSPQRPLRLRLLYNENELVQKVCVAISALWQESLGVETELVQMEFKAYLAARADPGQWDVVRVGWTADYNDASTFLDTMLEGSPQNFGRWVDADYARLLEAAANESDATRRRETLQQAEALMLQDYPLLPVYFYVTRRLVQPWVQAPPINPMNRTYSRYFRPAP
ncbi:MAG TPA: peptide ABC transporter substrate-binding protein [Steroidobacteraceae bacterium]|nr:peptide ABC transporter substrate-binding protein [Steroidobacteraceae bacterium]